MSTRKNNVRLFSAAGPGRLIKKDHDFFTISNEYVTPPGSRFSWYCFVSLVS
jgi:hypothetical protein